MACPEATDREITERLLAIDDEVFAAAVRARVAAIKEVQVAEMKRAADTQK